MLLSDGYLANGSEPWRIPERRRPARHRPGLRDRAQPRRSTDKDGDDVAEFWPYLRDEETLARPWAIPGTPGLEHRIGGLEKGDGHGNISYDPANHDLMVRTRQAKVDRIADSLPPLEVDDPSGEAKVLVLGWGSTYGPIGAGVPPGPQGRLSTSPRCTCATSTRSRRTSARSSSATTRCWCPR